MKPDPNATLIRRFSVAKTANEFVAWLYRNLLKPGETARTIENYPAGYTSVGVYVLGRKGAKIGRDRVSAMQAAADAFQWAWSLQEGNAALLRRAFLDVMDGTKDHDIQDMTGLASERCAEIGQLRNELLARR